MVVALFATGLKLERELTFRGWRNVARLLLVAMPLTIAAIALFGNLVMGLSAGAAIALGACLAPTDPVLAGDIGVGPPGDEDEREPNFSITGEAGLNDGLAFPFLLLGVALAEDSSLLEWALADVVYATSVGIAIGAAMGFGMGWLTVRLRDRDLLAPRARRAGSRSAPWRSSTALTEIVGAYGFLAAFAGGVGFRRYEHTPRAQRRRAPGRRGRRGRRGARAHPPARLLRDPRPASAEPGVSRLAARAAPPARHPPASAVLASLVRARQSLRERLFVGWFGVRGIGSLFYASVVVGLGVFGEEETSVIFWTVAVTVIVSIAVHGISATPLTRRWLPD